MNSYMGNNSFKELFYDTDLMIIIDRNGKVMYYEDYDDRINMLKTENVIGRSIYELYPFFGRKDFTVFRAMDSKKPILNDFQSFEVNGVAKKSMNSAFPLINESGVIGGIVISIELPRNPQKKKKDKLIAKYDFSDIMTQNKTFMDSLLGLKKMSLNDSNILVFGETGTGKELIAHAIHGNSKRKNKPLIIQNCAAIPASIMESLLFGTAKGSYTGAVDREGLFEAATGGTIFLDEINSMPLDLQSKILRTIENKSIRRIGETSEREIDVRVIASTNEHLEAKVERQEFRADLFYRLNVISFYIPPLRERRDDILLLCEHYIASYNLLLNKNVKGISDEAKERLVAYAWKGNVRELKNAMEYALNVKDFGKIEATDLPPYMHQTPLDISNPSLLQMPVPTSDLLHVQIAEFEKAIIRHAYKLCNGNISHMSKKLGIPRQTLYVKLKKYNIDENN